MHGRKRAFTLIELLVVVAIIALLVSILLPSLNRAREQAKRAVCASNVRQIAMAILQYCEDNDDVFPSHPYPSNENMGKLDEDGYDILYNVVWLYGGSSDNDSWAAQKPNGRPAERRPLYPYIYPEFFECPSDKGDYTCLTDETHFSRDGTSYPLNAYNWSTFQTVLDQSIGRLGVVHRRTTDVSNTHFVLTGDATMDDYFGDIDGYGEYTKVKVDGADEWVSDNPLKLWHDKRKQMANMAFIDGSASYHAIKSSRKGPRTANGSPYERYWWENENYSFMSMAKNKRPDPEYKP